MTPPAIHQPVALVVDDDFLIRLATQDILEQAGFRVLDAEHGDAARDLLGERHQEVSLLFTDVQMPGTLDGFALARHVAAHWSHIAIVVASGHARPGPGCLPDGAHFIAKPFSAEVVRAHLHEVLPPDRKPEPLKRQ